MLNTHPSQVTIILAEDDDVDAKSIRRAFQKAMLPHSIVRVEDGVEALELLRNQNGRVCPPAPYLLLVDLNMPRMNGLQLIAALRMDPLLKPTIVFVLTTSRRFEDKVAAYDLNIAGYIPKEKVSDDCSSLVSMVDYYARLVDFP